MDEKKECPHCGKYEFLLCGECAGEKAVAAHNSRNELLKAAVRVLWNSGLKR